MLRFTFMDARTWRYMIASVEKILDEGVFVAREDGLYFRALDSARVVMVDLAYPAEAFSEYEVEGGEVNFGVSFNMLAKVLRRARKDDQLRLVVDEASIEVVFVGRGERRFRIPQISLSVEVPGEPKIPFTVEARMMATSFREAVKTLEPVADMLTLAAIDEDRLLFRGQGDLESAELEFSMERQSLLDYQVESPDESTYSLEYFSQMLQAAQAAETAIVRFGADLPARVDFEYPGGGRLTFYVSPSV